MKQQARQAIHQGMKATPPNISKRAGQASAHAEYLEVAGFHAPLVVGIPQRHARAQHDLLAVPVEGVTLLEVRDDRPPTSIVLVQVLDFQRLVSTLAQRGNGPVVHRLLANPRSLSDLGGAVDLQVRGSRSIQVHLCKAM